MTISLVYLLGGGNSLVWSWFFWVYVHPLASITWFIFCLFTLFISIEVCQLQKNKISRSVINKSYKAIENLPEVIDVIVIPPAQLGYSQVKQTKPSKPVLVTAQLPNSFD